MSHVYKKRDTRKIRQFIRFTGLAISTISFLCFLYIIFPFISWKIYFEPAFASSTIQAPIPRTTVLSPDNIQTLISSAVDSINLDYSDARNWFPSYPSTPQRKPDPGVITTFNISIPKLGISYANVTTIDTDLSRHLVLYPGTAIPPAKGTAVIFGHSTIPSWFDPHNYKAIFATVHTLKVGDEINATVNTKEIHYRIYNISITNAQDTTVFAQDTSDSFLTLITCTPPGTTWKRLIVRARVEH